MSDTVREVIRFPEVKRITGLSRATIWRRVRAGTFPAPLQLGENTIGWDRAEIDGHQASLRRVNYAPAAAPPKRVTRHRHAEPAAATSEAA